MYICKTCKIEKPLTEFYDEVSKRGHTRNCKDCVKARNKKRYWENRDLLRKKSKEYYQRKDVKLRRRRKRAENREKKRAENRRSYLRHREKRVAEMRKYRKENKEVGYAHGAVKNAVRSGRLVRPKRCEYCNRGGQIVGHHEDYSKPLDVIWLCTSCHARIHADTFGEREMILQKLGRLP